MAPSDTPRTLGEQRQLRKLTLNAAELIRHPAATEQERHQAEQAVRLVRLNLLPAQVAHEAVSQARAQIRDRWAAQRQHGQQAA